MAPEAEAASSVEQTLNALDAAVRRVTEISTLPQVALRVIDIAQNPDAGAADLKNVVEGDPALSARVIRMVNSAAYGLRTTVTNLHQAISYLGFNQVRNLAMTASVSEIFKRDQVIGQYSRRTLWRHLVSVGICARLIARRCGIATFEDAFLAGLLHDIGIILEDQHAHDAFCQALRAGHPGTAFIDAERATLGFDHCVFGERIAEAWRFPDVARQSIRYHHGAMRYKGPGANIVQCVEAANVVCSLKGITSIGVKWVRPAVETFQTLGFQKEDLVVLVADLDKEIAGSEKLFEI